MRDSGGIHTQQRSTARFGNGNASPDELTSGGTDGSVSRESSGSVIIGRIVAGQSFQNSSFGAVSWFLTDTV